MALSSLSSFLIQHASNFLGSMVEEHQRSSYLRRVAPGKNGSYAGNQNYDKLDAGNQYHDELDAGNQNHDQNFSRRG